MSFNTVQELRAAIINIDTAVKVSIGNGTVKSVMRDLEASVRQMFQSLNDNKNWKEESMTAGHKFLFRFLKEYIIAKRSGQLDNGNFIEEQQAALQRFEKKVGSRGILATGKALGTERKVASGKAGPVMQTEPAPETSPSKSKAQSTKRKRDQDERMTGTALKKQRAAPKATSQVYSTACSRCARLKKLCIVAENALACYECKRLKMRCTNVSDPSDGKRLEVIDKGLPVPVPGTAQAPMRSNPSRTKQVPKSRPIVKSKKEENKEATSASTMIVSHLLTSAPAPALAPAISREKGKGKSTDEAWRDKEHGGLVPVPIPAMNAHQEAWMERVEKRMIRIQTDLDKVIAMFNKVDSALGYLQDISTVGGRIRDVEEHLGMPQ